MYMNHKHDQAMNKRWNTNKQLNNWIEKVQETYAKLCLYFLWTQMCDFPILSRYFTLEEGISY